MLPPLFKELDSGVNEIKVFITRDEAENLEGSHSMNTHRVGH